MEETDSKGTALTPLTPHGASVESNVTLCWVRMGSGCPNNAKLPPLVTWPSIRDGDTWYQYPLANTRALINLDCEERCSVSARPRNFKFEVFSFFLLSKKGSGRMLTTANRMFAHVFLRSSGKICSLGWGCSSHICAYLVGPSLTLYIYIIFLPFCAHK